MRWRKDGRVRFEGDDGYGREEQRKNEKRKSSPDASRNGESLKELEVS